MGEIMNQVMEILHVVIQGQEELRQNVAKLVDNAAIFENCGPKIANGGTPKGNPQVIVDDHHNVIDLYDPQDYLNTDMSKTTKMYRALEERLKAIEVTEPFGFNVASMCLVPGIVIPLNFKVPDFDKYKGASCPEAHLCSYCRKMVAYAENEPLLMHFFQGSLTRAPLDWYMQL